MALTRRAAMLSCLTAATISLFGGGVRPAAQQSGALTTFADLFHEYRRGNVVLALQTMSMLMTDRDLERDVKLPPGEDDPWSKAALALMMSQAGGLPDVEFRPSVVPMDKAIRLMGQVHDAAKASGDRELLTWCRDWYVASVSGLWADSTEGVAIEDDVRRRLADDPLAQLALGKRSEYMMRILEGEPDGYGIILPSANVRADTVGTSSHGPYGIEAAKAERAFRRAVTLDSTAIEARVHLGRVLWFLDRREDAERELMQAKSDAARLDAPVIGYLAGLFLGQLYEETNRLDDARAAFEGALRVYPSGQAARVALGRALVALGREADGWAMTSGALSAQAWEGHPPDPWAVFATRDENEWLNYRYEALRPRLHR
jgi:hypothetical protein